MQPSSPEDAASEPQEHELAALQRCTVQGEGPADLTHCPKPFVTFLLRSHKGAVHP